MVPEPIDRIMKQWMLLLSARVLRWSGGREALGVLFALALIGSAIVPLPIELALVVLVHAVPRRWIKSAPRWRPVPSSAGS